MSNHLEKVWQEKYPFKKKKPQQNQAQRKAGWMVKDREKMA